MRDHDDRLAKFLIEIAEHVQHDLRIFGVEISRRFVRQDNRRSVDDRSGQSDPLLLAARKLKRLMVHFIFKFQKLQDLAPPVGALASITTMDLFGQLEITLGRECRKQIKALKDKSNLTPPNVGPAGVRHLCKILAVNNNAAARGAQ